MDAMIGMYESLFAANWKVDGIEPQGFLGGYIRLMIDQQEWSKAGEVARRLHDPRIALALRSDLRSEPLIQAHPEILDVDALIELQITELEAAAQRYPRRLSAWIALFYAYLDSGRYRQVLALTEQLLDAATRGGSASNVFEDSEKMNWIHDHRARAWRGLGDWAAAEREFRLAANLSERGNANISNALNLASLLAEMGDEKSALQVLAQLSNRRNRISPYGLMTEMRARHIAALSSKDQAASNKALEYLRKNRDAAPNMLLEALVREQRFDEATSELDRRLADPELRWDALAFVQKYSTVPHLLPSQLSYLSSLEAWLSREDVRSSVNRVGRIGPAALTSQWL
jgi:tetratricopeptide (TPR) repeat protein